MADRCRMSPHTPLERGIPQEPASIVAAGPPPDERELSAAAHTARAQRHQPAARTDAKTTGLMHVPSAELSGCGSEPPPRPTPYRNDAPFKWNNSTQFASKLTCKLLIYDR